MEFITLLLIIFLFAILFLVYKYLQTIRDANIIRNLGLKGKNLCDQLPFTFVFDFARCQWQPYLLADYYYKKYGRVHGGFLVSQPALTVGDPEILKQILVKDFAKFHDRFMPMPLPGLSEKSMFVTEGERWKFIRTTLTPTFTSGKLRQMSDLMNSLGNILISKLKADADSKKSTDFLSLLQSYSMDVILSSAFGVDAETQTNPNNSVTQKARLSLTVPWWVYLIIGLPYSEKWLKYVPLLFGSRFHSIADVASLVIKDRRQGHTYRKDLLQLMLEAQKEPDSKGRTLQDDEMVAQSVLFINGGYETTATTLALVCYHLALYPDVQEKLYSEVIECWPEDDSLPNLDVTQKMNYMEMVISEVLRLYPPVLALLRKCNESCEIKGIQFPKGCAVFAPVYSIHRDPEFWDEPEKFDPERFSPEAKASRDPYTYLPFGSGPRHCIGMRFALMEMKIILSRILKGFKLETTSETEIPVKLTSQATLTVRSPIKLRALKRQK